MPQRRLVVLIMLCLATVMPLLAQHMNEKDSPCADKVSTSDQVECLSKAKVSADKELNALYQEIRKNLDADETKQLTTAEILWIQYRNANCEAERSLYGLGTGASPTYLACLESMTTARTRELRTTYAVRLK